MGKVFTTILKEAYGFPKHEQAVIKQVVKDWLENISLPRLDSETSTVELLICLVDEPE